MQATLDHAVHLPTARAGFWRRLASAVIDAILLAIVGAIIGFAAGRGIEFALSWLISLAYFTWFHGSRGQTPGDAALGLKVLDLRSEFAQPIGYGRAALRWLVSIVSAAVILLGFLWMLWDGEKQTWHDKAAGSVVVPVDEL